MGNCTIHKPGQAEHEEGIRKAAKAADKAKAKPKGKAKAKSKARAKQAPGDDFPAGMLPDDPIEPVEPASKKAANTQEKARIDDSLKQLAVAGLVDCGPPAMLSSGTPPSEFFKNFSGKRLIRIFSLS